MARMKTGIVKPAHIRHHRLRWVLSLSTGSLIALLSYWYCFLRPTVESDDAYVTGNIIPIQALTPGIVTQVFVDDTLRVHPGQPLVEEDRHLSYATLLQSESGLAAVVRSTSALFHQATSEQAELSRLQTQRLKLSDDLGRYREAVGAGAVSAQLVSDTEKEIETLDKSIDKATAQWHKANALVAGTSVRNNPLVSQARGRYIAAYIDYQRGHILSPIDGYISNRQVQAGESLKTGQKLMSIVPLDHLWVTANIKETRIQGVRAGEPVRIDTHSYSSDFTYHGTVLGLDPSGGSIFSLFPPNNATGNYIHIVERIPVRISLDPSELARHPLRPGMSVTVSIDTHEQGKFRDLDSRLVVQDPSYETRLFDNELSLAQTSADKIIAENL